MKFLLDTMVVSETRKSIPDANVLSWLASIARHDQYLSVATLYEIQRGIALAERRDRPFAEILSRWLDELAHSYARQIVPVDDGIARRWGSLSGAVGNESVDLIIGATALERGLIVATRDIRDFLRAGVTTLNPFEADPAPIRPPL
ncbi:MAG: type II toxin-antitoxin system VapC family toxin [Rhodospirillales bacterium]